MIVLCILLFVAPCLAVALPILALEASRRASRAHVPQPNELWSQDSTTLLYIEGVDATCLHLLSVDKATSRVTRWSETWSAWAARCRNRVVLFTGRTGSLDPFDAMLT